jgi:hypothetical protein
MKWIPHCFFLLFLMLDRYSSSFPLKVCSGTVATKLASPRSIIYCKGYNLFPNNVPDRRNCIGWFESVTVTMHQNALEEYILHPFSNIYRPLIYFILKNDEYLRTE